jgi:predicted esterase
MRIIRTLLIIFSILYVAYTFFSWGDGPLKIEGKYPEKTMKSYSARYKEPRNEFEPYYATIGNTQLTFYIYASKKNPDTPKPLVVLLHGSGRTGSAMIDMWKDTADEHELVLVAPNSKDSKRWPHDLEDFIRLLPYSIAQNYPVDFSRVYLFGHSAGGMMTMYIASEDPGPYAAFAVHGGRMPYSTFRSRLQLGVHFDRKRPIQYLIGEYDESFPLGDVIDDAKVLHDAGFPIKVTILKNHNHWYYDNADYINSLALEFFARHAFLSEGED